MSLFDTNIDNYTIEELFAILNLEEDALPYEIEGVSNKYIERYKSSNPTVSLFFQKIRENVFSCEKIFHTVGIRKSFLKR